MGVWATVVLVGGGLTLWLQDAAEPRRYGWEPAESDPDLRPEPLKYGDYATLCPSGGVADDGTFVACAVQTTR
ncbi:hypothetical protein GCM10027072_19790 [Streptomyces bullii]